MNVGFEFMNIGTLIKCSPKLIIITNSLVGIDNWKKNSTPYLQRSEFQEQKMNLVSCEVAIYAKLSEII